MTPRETVAAVPRPPRFRWRLLPTIFCGVFAFSGILGSLGTAALMVYANVKFGAYVPDPDITPVNPFALTPGNIAQVALTFIGGIVGALACVRWWRGEWRLAVLLTVVLIGTMAAIGHLG